MKTIVIKGLTLENFKGQQWRDLFFDGKSAVVSGPNGCGKSTIADAISWVLFGKNAQGQQAEGKGGFSLKTIDPKTGEAIPRISHSVALSLIVDGTEVVLERDLSEEWVKRRGQAEEEFKGHTVTYKINGTPVKVAEYAQAVADICDEGKFQLLTRPGFFFSLKWQDQRDMLVSMVGVPSLKDTAIECNLADILSLIGDEDLAKFKERKAYELKKLKPELEACAPRVEGIRKVMPAVEHAEAELKNTETRLLDERYKKQMQLAELTAIPSESEQLQAQLERQERDLQSCIAEHERAQRAEVAERDAKTSLAQTKRDKAVADAGALLADVRNRYNTAVYHEEATASALKLMQERVDRLTDKMTSLRDQWQQANSRTMLRAEGNDIVCPLSQMVCTSAEMIRGAALKAHEEFENLKAADKKCIEQVAAQTKTDLKAAEEKLAKLKEQLKEDSANAEALKLELASAEKAYDEGKARAEETMRAEIEAIEADKRKGIDERHLDHTKRREELQRCIEVTRAKLASAKGETTDTSARDALNAEIEAIEGTINDVRDELAQLAQRAKCEAEIEAIQKKERELAQQIAAIETEVFQADRLHHAQMDALEERVNAMFGGQLTVRLFEKQINGGEAESCTILRDGVRYNDLNTAGKAHAGLALIKAVQNHLGILAPTIIDNAESVTAWPDMECQMIYLSVDAATELTVKTL